MSVISLLWFPVLQLGGAMAPAIKELSQWLDANSEYYVAPDWADVIKTSVSSARNHSILKHLDILPLGSPIGEDRCLSYRSISQHRRQWRSGGNTA